MYRLSHISMKWTTLDTPGRTKPQTPARADGPSVPSLETNLNQLWWQEMEVVLYEGQTAWAYLHPSPSEGKRLKRTRVPSSASSEGRKHKQSFPRDKSETNLYILQCTDMGEKLSWEGQSPSMPSLRIVPYVLQQTVVERMFRCKTTRPNYSWSKNLDINWMSRKQFIWMSPLEYQRTIKLIFRRERQIMIHKFEEPADLNRVPTVLHF